MNYTQEQLDVIKACNTTGNKIVSINAIAGSGKTSVCCGIVNSVRPKHGFYTAFNRAIVEDSNDKFGELIPCRTLHSLAYRYANPGRKGIKEFTYRDIDRVDRIKDKIKIIDIIDRFFLSKYDNFDDYLEKYPEDILYKNEVLYYMDEMLNDKINPTFSFLLKKFHLMLLDKEVNPCFDLFIIDECQDLSEVMLEIFKLINAEKKVILGDKYQNIYSFMNTVNAFEELDKDSMESYRLTKCFRCKDYIGDLVQEYGKQYLETGYKFEGCLKEDKKDTKIAYLCKLNASLIRTMYNLLAEGKTFKLIRSVNDIFEFPLAMENLIKGKEVFSKKYKYLEDIRREANCIGIPLLIEISNNNKLDEQTRFMADLLKDFIKDKINLYELKEKVIKMKPNPNIIVSTIHAYKGLEADKVYLDTDIHESLSRVVSKSTPEAFKQLGVPAPAEILRANCDSKMKETLNLMYVGMSRAKHTLVG